MVKYLYETYLEEGLGVSFKGKGLVWNTAEDGKFPVNYSLIQVQV